MSERRSFVCPNCGDAVGALIERTSIRCDYKVIKWRSVQTGVNRKKEPTYEHCQVTEPGCGGILHNCFHGNKICPTCPIRFEPSTEPPIVLATLADVLRDETEAKHMREQAAKDAERSYSPPRQQPTSSAPTGRKAPIKVERQAQKPPPLKKGQRR